MILSVMGIGVWYQVLSGGGRPSSSSLVLVAAALLVLLAISTMVTIDFELGLFFAPVLCAFAVPGPCTAATCGQLQKRRTGEKVREIALDTLRSHLRLGV